MSRALIVHYHIYKNAGTSVDAVLQRHFGPSWAPFDREAPGAIIRPDELRGFIESRPEVRAVSSHQCRPPLPSGGGIEIHPIFVLRHPLDRIGSIYRFERVQPGDNPGPRKAREASFAEYVEWRLASARGGVVRNFQLLSLTSAHAAGSAPWEVVADRGRLAEAQDFLESLPAFGLVERFEESLDRFQRRLAPHFPGLDFFVTRKNVTSGSAPLAERLRQMRDQLGAALFARLEESNALDLELYDFACRAFERAGEPAPRASLSHP